MFRPCIDLHEGRVKQIVGGTLGENPGQLKTNFVSERPAKYFAELYKQDQLTGGHVIMLGPGNTEAAREALAVYPGGLQIGGGVTIDNAAEFLSWGASHVIVTSWIFRDGQLDLGRLEDLVKSIGRERLVLDLSCRKRAQDYFVVTDRWQKFTSLKVDSQSLSALSTYCSEFLIHGVDVEGLCLGIDTSLVTLIAQESPIPCTYAGGARSMEDLELVTTMSANRVDLTIGSALDLFGGNGVRYADAVAFNLKTGVAQDESS